MRISTLFKEKFIKKYWDENVCFQISSDLQFRRHITNGNLCRVECAIKMMNNAKDLIPPPSENEIVSKLSRHFLGDIRTAIIIINVKTHENLIELLDAFDQASLSTQVLAIMVIMVIIYIKIKDFVLIIMENVRIQMKIILENIILSQI